MKKEMLRRKLCNNSSPLFILSQQQQQQNLIRKLYHCYRTLSLQQSKTSLSCWMFFAKKYRTPIYPQQRLLFSWNNYKVYNPKRYYNISTVRSFATAAAASVKDGEIKSTDATYVRFTKASTSMMMYSIISMSIAFTFGVIVGRNMQQESNTNHEKGNSQKKLILPNGLPRTCCETDKKEQSSNSSIQNDNEVTTRPVQHFQLTPVQEQLPKRLQRIVGKDNVILVGGSNTSSLTTVTAPFLKGARIRHDTDQQQQQQQTICIVTPKHLHHVVNVIEACIDANCVIVPQGQNTGLTGGSTPRNYNYNNSTTHENHSSDGNSNNDDFRPIVLLSFKHLNAIFPIDDGQRVVCMAGAGLASLEQFLQNNFPDRESHSILGSTFLNPTTGAGVAFGSGGTQCRKGPAYTERALYVKISTNKWQEKKVEVINSLHVDGFDDIDLPSNLARKQMDTIPYRIDTWGRWIQEGYEHGMKYSSRSILDAMKTNQLFPLASDVHYAAKLCRRDSTSVSRHNADCSGPDCCRSEGKVIILATVHDTFPKPLSKKTYWVSFDSFDTALQFRRLVALDNPTDLPISMEYMDRDSFDVINDAGRVLGNLIKYIGTSSTIIRQLWNIKLYIEALPYSTAPLWMDQLLYRLNNYFPPILPKSIMKIGNDRNHHVVLTIGEFGDSTMDRIIDRMHQFVAKYGSEKVEIHECVSSQDIAALSAFRFVAAPAFRTWCVGNNMQGFSVDYALPKNGGSIPPLARRRSNIGSGVEEGIHSVPVKRMRYSHFACNVVHEDLAYTPDVDIEHAKHVLKDVIEYDCNGKLPAEHGHGTEYVAPKNTQERWKMMDPLNVFNPGIGGLPYKFRYKE